MQTEALIMDLVFPHLLSDHNQQQIGSCLSMAFRLRNEMGLEILLIITKKRKVKTSEEAENCFDAVRIP